ncbi:hypothetical protein, partial [Thermofilum sp.]|uniref:hypothetical protein n=1 Tax=Thermofilum sp. TaxID=1961369 RepID=UPI003175901C
LESIWFQEKDLEKVWAFYLQKNGGSVNRALEEFKLKAEAFKKTEEGKRLTAQVDEVIKKVSEDMERKRMLEDKLYMEAAAGAGGRAENLVGTAAEKAGRPTEPAGEKTKAEAGNVVYIGKKDESFYAGIAKKVLDKHGSAVLVARGTFIEKAEKVKDKLRSQGYVIKNVARGKEVLKDPEGKMRNVKVMKIEVLKREKVSGASGRGGQESSSKTFPSTVYVGGKDVSLYVKVAKKAIKAHGFAVLEARGQNVGKAEEAVRRLTQSNKYVVRKHVKGKTVLKGEDGKPLEVEAVHVELACRTQAEA